MGFSFLSRLAHGSVLTACVLFPTGANALSAMLKTQGTKALTGPAIDGDLIDTREEAVLVLKLLKREEIISADVDSDELIGAAKEATKKFLEKRAKGNKSPLSFNEFADQGLAKGVAFSPVGSGQSYKVDLVVYHIYFGDEDFFKLPFLLAYGESTSEDAAEKASNTLLDPSNGLAVTFPLYGVYEPASGLCGFGDSGYCKLGGEINIAYKDFEAGSSSRSSIGWNASLGVAFQFPIRRASHKDIVDGDLAVRFAYGHYKYDDEDLKSVYGNVSDVNGNSIAYDDSFRSTTLEVNWTIYNQFSLNYTYYKPVDSDLRGINRISIAKGF